MSADAMGGRADKEIDKARRRVLHGFALAALSVIPASVLLAVSTHASTAPRQRGGARIDVRSHGARGDGVHDDTRAFQDAIDALPPEGGTVQVPAGNYLLDPVRSVRLRSRMHLAMEPEARLIAKPNSAERAYVLSVQQVDDVEVSGGRIVGDRIAHTGTAGEWGHGVMVRGATGITVRNLHVSQCWGDGISIGGAKAQDGRIVPSRDVVIADVVCDGNRRQGLTIGRSRQVRVYRSQFVNTGGTLPGCGIDVEPDAGDIAQDVRIEDCLVRGNWGAGIQLYRRVSDASIRGCTIEENRGDGVVVIGAQDCIVSGNVIRRNGLAGVGLRRGARNILVGDNQFSGNRRNAGRAKPAPGKSAQSRHVTVAPETTSIRITDNHYQD